MRLSLAVVVALVASSVFVFAGCSGSGGSKATTPTAQPVPSVEQITALVGQGFVGEEIPYSATLVSAFTDPVAVIDVVKQCAGPAPAAGARDANYWPVLLGQCYFAGNATMRLYQFTNRSEFLDANRLIERLHRARLNEAQADGAAIGEPYWQIVTKAVYDVAFMPASPSAVSPTP